MPRYAPLPSVSIDPRNEAQIVQDAARRVYDVSNQTLNDFSSGNPLAALLEGQAFAQGELLYWANQLPQSILLEWIGPFLGAMRSLGTASTARLLLTVPPSGSLIQIPAGTTFSTNANLTGGVSVTFVLDTDVVIPPGETSVYSTVSSQYVGTQNNVPANSITVTYGAGITNLSVTNPQPATGGTNVETYRQVQERFFTLIRRRNPVSETDWQNFFIDLYGTGTVTTVQPNRPNQGSYNYLSDYLLPNGQVSFFVLGPNGVELTKDQLERGQNLVNFSVPVENQAHLYPLTLSQVQYNISLEIDANGAFGGNFKQSSLNFRDRLFLNLTPGQYFPANTNPTVSDVDAAFYSTFSENTRFTDPRIKESSAYNTPALLEPSAATYTQVYSFEPTEYLLTQNDLVEVSEPTQTFYSVDTSFTPVSGDKRDQPIYGNLGLRQIRNLDVDQYSQGDIVYWNTSIGGDGQLHVVLDNTVVSNPTEIPVLIATGKISSAKTYSPWITGNIYVNTVSGVFNPDIVQYDYELDEFEPNPLSPIPLNKRPGSFAWLVTANFTLQASTDTLTGAQTALNLSSLPVTPQQLLSGNTYSASTWVFTPQIGSGPNPVVDPYYYYVNVTEGVVTKYAYVVSSFTFDPGEMTVSEYFDSLVTQGVIKEIVVQNADLGLPIYKYKPRFPFGTYLEYRSSAGAAPEYYIASNYFTPSSNQIQDIIDEGVVLPLAPTEALYTQFVAELAAGTIKKPTRMFRFFAGDRTFFRQGSTVLSYTATTNVTPLFAFPIYQQAGVFVLSESYPSSFTVTDYIPYYSPNYTKYSEDSILSEDGRNLFRVMRAFSPSVTVVDWTNTTVTNTARIQEYQGNLLRYVVKYVCEEEILSQLGRDISAIKLGVAQITLIPKNFGRFTDSQQKVLYIWENTDSVDKVPQLSYYTGTSYQYSPPNYREGTLNL